MNPGLARFDPGARPVWIRGRKERILPPFLGTECIPGFARFGLVSGFSPWGTLSRGQSRGTSLAGGGSGFGAAVQRVEVVPNWNGLNWRVISNRQPPMKLAPVREAPGRRPGNGAPPKPRSSQSPSEGGCRGTECCPFFCSICRPQSGRVGNETMPFFLQHPGMLPDYKNCDNTSELAFFPSKAGRCHNSSNLANDGTASKKRSKGPKTGLVRTLASGKRNNLKERSKAPNWWPGSSPCRGA